MTERVVDLQWVPHNNSQFVTWGTELRHYRLAEGDPVLLASTAEPHYVRCAALWPGPGLVLAAGQANGRVSLMSFPGCGGEGGGLVGLQLGPRTPRQCTALAWSPTASHSLLAAGFERHRSDYGLVVWDLAQGRTGERPVVELGLTESCCSLAWLHRSPATLAAGLNGKVVRLCDTRSGSSKPAASTQTKATLGLAVDPSMDCRLAGYTENQVLIWDTRNFDRPVVSLELERAVWRLAWCRDRAGLLASSARDSPNLLLHHIMSWPGPGAGEDGEPSVTARLVAPPRPLNTIAGFAWHSRQPSPGRGQQLLAVGPGGQFAQWEVADRLTLAWGARHSLAWCGGRDLLTTASQQEAVETGRDIALVMQDRAAAGYCATDKPAREDLSPELEAAWNWVERGGAGAGKAGRGVRALLRTAGPSEARQARLGGVRGRALTTYRGEGREAVLRLCGWRPGSPPPRSQQANTLAAAARRAAIAVFSLDLRRAVSELQTGAAAARAAGDAATAGLLGMAGVAVGGHGAGDGAGGAGEAAELWREAVAGSGADSLPHPALRAIFTFLASPAGTESQAAVLGEAELPLVDRLGFAVTFLPDSALEAWLEREWGVALQHGRLDALLLSGGAGQETVQLVQRYVDRTGDVQTASWLAVRGLAPELAAGEAAQHWLESYRTLLDQWNMFSARAELDIALTAATGARAVSPQVYVCCHYCGKSISGWRQQSGGPGHTGSLSRQQTAATNKARVQSCPACKKPLPRCAVCLVNMGTASGGGAGWWEGATREAEGKGGPLSQFSSWLTWCQTCRHGGHAAHLMDWFSEHTECPVTGCSCKCGQLDSGL